MRLKPAFEKISFLVLLLGTLGISPINGLACSCPYFIPGPKLVKQEALRSEVIFIGKVIDSSFQMRTFEIFRNIKGLEGVNRIVSGNFSSCSTLYGKGYYIIYGTLEGDLLNTSYCSNNEKLLPDDYKHVGAHDTLLFENMLKNGIEKHNFHIQYLQDLFEVQPNKSMFFGSIGNNNWYRYYTIYSSMIWSGIGFILILVLYSIIRSVKINFNFRRWFIIPCLLSVLLCALSTLVYNESKPMGFETNIIQQFYGFPKYIYSQQLNASTGSPISSEIHYINLVGNLLVYFVTFGVVSLTYLLIKNRRAID